MRRREQNGVPRAPLLIKQVDEMAGTLGIKTRAHQCPDSEVRITLRQPHLRTSESKDTSNLLI